MHKKFLLPEFSLIVFLDGLPSGVKEKVSAVQHQGTQLTVHLNAALSFDEEGTLAQYVSAHDVNASLSASAQKEQDLDRYMRRATVKNQIIAELAAENMERVRNGTWTVADLISLTMDVELKGVLDDINTLSFELAYSKVAALTNPIVTTEIKTQWQTKLMSHFYL